MILQFPRTNKMIRILLGIIKNAKNYIRWLKNNLVKMH